MDPWFRSHSEGSSGWERPTKHSPLPPPAPPLGQGQSGRVYESPSQGQRWRLWTRNGNAVYPLSNCLTNVGILSDTSRLLLLWGDGRVVLFSIKSFPWSRAFQNPRAHFKSHLADKTHSSGFGAARRKSEPQSSPLERDGRVNSAARRPAGSAAGQAVPLCLVPDPRKGPLWGLLFCHVCQGIWAWR